MIGGGEWTCTINPDVSVDQELFVRMAEVSALFPMMQFSWAPWKVLDSEHLEIMVKMAELHEKMSDEIISLVRKAEKSGEPIIRSLEYNFPAMGYGKIIDEFMLGEDILVAPVVTPETYKRNVVFPEGEWIDENGVTYTGNSTQMLDAPLDTLLWFRRKK